MTKQVSLDTIPEENRHLYVGKWFEVKSCPHVVGIYEGPYLGARLNIPTRYDDLYTDPENLIYRPDLQPAYNHDGTPLERTPQ